MRRLLVVVLIAVVACSGDQPETSAWLAEVWHPTLRLVPPPEQVSPQTCDAALGELRERATTIRPAPSPQLGDAVDAWMRTAQNLMFECAAAEPDFDYQAGYEELEVLESEVAAVIPDQ